MKNEFVLSRDAMNELETFSAKYEQMRGLIEFIKEFVWSEVTERHEGKEIEKLGVFVDALLDVAHSRENDLEAVIKKISLMPDVIEGGD